MLARLRAQLTYANVVSTLCLILVVGGGGAYASHLVVDSSDVVDNSLTGTDVRGKPRTSTAAAVNGSLTTDDIAGQQAHTPTGTPFVDGTLTQWDVKNGGLVGGDLANNTLGGGKVTDNSITGADVDEASLGQVPLATLGGIGRWGRAAGECDPGSEALATCAVTAIDFPRPARVLLLGVVKAQAGTGAGATGRCLLSSQDGGFFESMSGFSVGGSTADAKFIPLMVSPGVFGPGRVFFGVACIEQAGAGDLRIFDAAVAAVALSPN